MNVVGTAVKVVVVTCFYVYRRCKRFVQEGINTCVKCLYVSTGDKFHLGVNIVYGCVSYNRSLLLVESVAVLLQSGRCSLHLLLTGSLCITIKNKIIKLKYTIKLLIATA